MTKIPSYYSKIMQSQQTLKRKSSIDVANEFKVTTRRDAEVRMKIALKNLITNAKMERRNRLQKEFHGFEVLFKRYLDEASTEIQWDNIKLLDDNEVKPYAHLPEADAEVIQKYLNEILVIKLNGGLGTSMGCTGPKSLISVRSDLTFLDLTIQQIETLNNKYDCDIPLILMNSFNTQQDTMEVTRKYNNVNVTIETFEQSMYPRIHRESLQPITKLAHLDSNDNQNKNSKDSEEEAWYPPGHGDVYRSFLNSGLLDKYIAQGKKFAFISNIDNMGATIDLKILSFLMDSLKTDKSPEFVMEVTDKTRADVKGGTLIKYDNKLRLLEMAQVPKDRIDEFTSVRKFRIFNTNNLWVSLSAVKRAVIEETLHMDVIVNPKTLDNGTNIIQLEEASGSAIKSFNNAIGINVPRNRFLPVKQCADLLLVMSNLYELSKGCLVMSPKRSFPSVPLIKLGTHFKKVKDCLSRFSSIPNMLELDHLTVSGDVSFGKNVVLKGTVIIIANHGEKIDIPSGSILDNKIVSGNLRILDH